jgi:SAM-dependent methyltransferase
MAFRLEKVVPWGRSFDEYVAMFDLSKGDLAKRILGCGDGPAAFNTVLTKRGGWVISADPLYRLSTAEIRDRIDETYNEVIEQTRANASEFVWRLIPSVEELGRIRMSAMTNFLDDYPEGRREGRYLQADLPTLPFRDRAFQLALCSHFLFLYSEHLTADFHLASIREICRVADEARIFPLLELGGKESRHLTSVLNRLREEGFSVKIEIVPYEFQKRGNRMLRVSAEE